MIPVLTEMHEKLDLPWKYKVVLVWCIAKLTLEEKNKNEGKN